jgi:hypothetical protein
MREEINMKVVTPEGMQTLGQPFYRKVQQLLA